MNKKVQSNYEALASANGLRLDVESGVIYGSFNGYELQMYIQNANQPYMFVMNFPVRRSAEPLTKEECKTFAKQYKQISTVQHKQDVVKIFLKACSKQEKLQANVNEALYVATGFLRQNGFESCCQACGQVVETQSCMIGNAAMQLCPDCYQKISQDTSMKIQQKEQTSENLVGGIVGALLGSLVGAICILLISQLGYVAAISGVVMAVCTLKGYEILGKKLTKRGVVISVILMLVITFFTNQLDWAIFVNKELGWGIGYSYQAIPYLMEQGAISTGSYYGNLAMIYIFLLLGAIPMVHNTMKNQKNEGRMYRM